MAGNVAGLPVGLSFLGPPWSEPVLIALSYAFEQCSPPPPPPAMVAARSDAAEPAPRVLRDAGSGRMSGITPGPGHGSAA
jgi:hypothetical protein